MEKHTVELKNTPGCMHSVSRSVHRRVCSELRLVTQTEDNIKDFPIIVEATRKEKVGQEGPGARGREQFANRH